MTTRILISAGGTGGGVYPALAVVSALRQHPDAPQIHFVSSTHGIENELIEHENVHFDTWHRVQGGPVVGVSLARKLLSLLRLGLGTLQACWLLIRNRPHAIFLTGGWVGVPIALAAGGLRIPVLIYVPDVEPASALKLLGRFAKVVTATVADTKAYFPPKKTVIATGYPLREGLLNRHRDEAIQAFGLDSSKRTLLVFGGSRGSRAINRMIYNHIQAFLTIPNLQILHISGKLDAVEVAEARAAMPVHLQARYHVRDYVYDMGLAFAAADLVISRAGASTLAELPAFGLPSVLIPLAYDWHYQEVNADWLASRGAAIRLDEPDMENQLLPIIERLLSEKDEVFNNMRQAAFSLKKTDGAETIAEVIMRHATKRNKG